MYQALSESVRSKVYLHHEGENQESVLVKTSAPSRLSKTELKNEFEVTKIKSFRYQETCKRKYLSKQRWLLL